MGSKVLSTEVGVADERVDEAADAVDLGRRPRRRR
jgi:hypothetical protein